MTSEPYVLADTSCWIEYFHPKGAGKVKLAMREAILADRLAACGPVTCEIIRGAARSDRARMRQALEGQTYLAQEDGDWQEVGRLLGELHDKGAQPPVLDVLIAVLAKRHAATLWHFGDGHFDVIGRVAGGVFVDLKA
jgi:predicted nucleic acid-binding protein